MFFHKSFQQLSDCPPPISETTSSHLSHRHITQKLSSPPSQGFIQGKPSRCALHAAYWPGIWNINMLRIWKNLYTCQFATCNSILFLRYCEGWNISHIQSESSCDMEPHLYLPNNSPAVFHFYGHLNRITSRIASICQTRVIDGTGVVLQETQLPWAMVAAAYAPNALGGSKWSCQIHWSLSIPWL